MATPLACNFSITVGVAGLQTKYCISTTKCMTGLKLELIPIRRVFSHLVTYTVFIQIEAAPQLVEMVAAHGAL